MNHTATHWLKFKPASWFCSVHKLLKFHLQTSNKIKQHQALSQALAPKVSSLSSLTIGILGDATKGETITF